MLTEQQTKLDIYINYPGHCEKSFQFYQEHLGREIQRRSIYETGKYTICKPFRHATGSIRNFLDDPASNCRELSTFGKKSTNSSGISSTKQQ